MTRSERLFRELKCPISDGTTAHIIPHCNYVQGLYYLWTDYEAYCNGVEDFTMNVYVDPYNDVLYAVPASPADFAILMDDAIRNCGDHALVSSWISGLDRRMPLDDFVELYETFVNIWKEVK